MSVSPTQKPLPDQVAMALNDTETTSSEKPASSIHRSLPMAAFNARLCSKLDLRILTPMFFLNFLSLMGRTNIGAALIQHLPKDLKLDAMKIFLVVSIPLVMLILFEVPSNLIMKWLESRFGLSYMRYLSLITVGLGLVTLGQAFDQSYAALLATRFLVGIFDSGLMPGCVFVLSLYYPSVHLQWRMSMLMVANIVSNIISNILAYGISNIHASNGYSGWRWIFMVEGLLTIAIGAICVWSDIGRPEKSTFLSHEEKDVIHSLVESRTSTIGIAAELKVFFSNPLNYAWAALYVFTCTTLYSVAIFAPSFVQAFHPDWKVPQVQGQVVPIFVVDCVVCLLAGWASDRLNHRSGFALAGYVLTIIGYAMLRVPNRFSPAIQMLALYFVSMGTYISLPMIWALTQLNSATPFQKALGSAFVIGVGNVGGFVSAWIFRSSEAPHYSAGMTDGLILTCVATGLIIVAWVYMKMANRRISETKDESNEGLASGVVTKFRC
ncbi:major facilitator superfamily domain-containing protein [Pseudomassariella vexata]|uniref:Major facilitator superfamily domain-containing protein n=1 Tax=Pseudomassariella vexata TaxID=1141098 RepID=A0A1Y2DW27_9PEZI|nr:major facilitator superfamily domain-containing protein [Pseudomassariella vexata]ORY63468.1 major facilitator superfamily domain-containing protein [Pseudomassariella vexata]